MKTALLLLVLAVLLREGATRLVPFPEPVPSPHPNLAPDAVVRIVTESLQHVNSPRPNAGIYAAYQFASPANKQVTGPYGRFLTLVKHEAFSTLLRPGFAEFGPLVVAGQEARQLITIRPPHAPAERFQFELSRQAGGPWADCWMVDGVIPAP